MTQFYLVGGAVRDKILQVSSKDMDFAVEAPSFAAMRDEIERRGGEIFLETPEYLTIRARVPKLGAADFVLCRKDGAYIDGRRPEDVEPGTLMDDLARRDFTMNAIAMDEDGKYIDPFGGQADIEDKLIRCVGNTHDRFAEDYLRMLRAIRFGITKNMRLDHPIIQCFLDPKLVGKLAYVSVERVREELFKCFKYNTLNMLYVLEGFPLVRDMVLGNSGMWLKPTLEK